MFHRVAPSIFVSDLDRAVAFYRDVLGLKLICTDDPPRRFVVADERAVLHLDLDAARAGQCSTHILVDDLAAVYELLQKGNATVTQPPTDQPWGLRELVMQDPDGNVFELAQPIER